MWKGGPWSVVCVNIQDGECKEQPIENRFVLSVASAADVDAAHAAAKSHQATYAIRKLEPVAEKAGVRSFCLQDLNRHWWEITTTAQRDYDALFAKGDHARAENRGVEKSLRMPAEASSRLADRRHRP